MKFEKIILLCIVVLAVILRFYQIDKNPPGLYIDEVAIGNNAYKILTTGKDEYGIAHPLWFRSFGDYKMPVYIYSVAGSMAVFGKNEFSIRFPSAVAGVLTVLVIYFFVKNLLALDKSFTFQGKEYLPLLSAVLLAISSWHIHFSRGGFEVNLALFFYMLGLLLLVLYLRYKKVRYLLLSVALFIFSMYTYHSFRVTAPLTIFLSIAYLFHKKVGERKYILIAAAVSILFIFPIFQFSFTKEGSERLAQTSALSEYKVNNNFEKLTTYPLVYIKNYASFFSFDFLFSFGDGNGRHQVASFGLLYRFEFIFLILGIYFLFKKKKSYFFIILVGMLLLAVVPASLSRPSPHSLRALPMIVPLTIIIGLGMIVASNFIKKQRVIALPIIFLIAIYELFLIGHFYTQHYPKINLLDWGSSYKEVVLESKNMQDKYPKIFVDGRIGNIKPYYDFYAEGAKYDMVGSDWVKPSGFKDKKVLYIRPYYGPNNDPKIIKNIIFPNVNKDIIVQFWEI